MLSLYDVGRGKTEREIRLPSLDEVLNPSWSPDGRRIAFAGLVGGLSDLFVYDLEANQLKRLTNDAFADLQPAWSPDGRTLAFATDRFTTDLGQLTIGRYAIGLLDVATGTVSRLPGFDGARHINPQWSPDGASLFFVADPGESPTSSGSSSLVAPLPRSPTCIPVSAASPKPVRRCRWPSESGRLVYSVFRANGYEVYAIDSRRACWRGHPFRADSALAAHRRSSTGGAAEYPARGPAE